MGSASDDGALADGPSSAPGPDALAGWVEATRRGDREAARRLLDAVAPAMRNVVRRALGAAHADSEDLLQESLVGFVRALDSFRGESSVLHYARRIALWRVLEDQKRRHAQKRAPEAQLHAASDHAIDPHARADGLDERRRTRVRELMFTLRPEQAETLALRHVLDYSVEEIARAMRVPANTVRSRLRLAKDTLRARIAEDAFFSELDIRQP